MLPSGVRRGAQDYDNCLYEYDYGILWYIIIVIYCIMRDIIQDCDLVTWYIIMIMYYYDQAAIGGTLTQTLTSWILAVSVAYRLIYLRCLLVLVGPGLLRHKSRDFP